MSDTIRAFIAVDFDAKIKHSIKRLQDHLRKTDFDVKWVEPEYIHITLKFLGNINIDRINITKQTLASHYQNARSFKIELTQLGAFPDIDHPRILWIGIEDDKQQLIRMAASLQKALAKIGFEADPKPFSPHVTIGRIRSSKNIQLLSASVSNYRTSGTLAQAISEIILFKSTLSSEGPTHKPLYRIKLKK